MRRPTENIETFKRRRIEIGEVLKGAALIVASHPEQVRNSSVHFHG